MLCLHCQVPLSTVNHYSIGVVECPKCCGIWLTQEQLEKIVQYAQVVDTPKKPELIDEIKVDEVKVGEVKRAPRRKRAHFLSGAFDISDDW